MDEEWNSVKRMFARNVREIIFWLVIVVIIQLSNA